MTDQWPPSDGDPTAPQDPQSWSPVPPPAPPVAAPPPLAPPTPHWATPESAAPTGGAPTWAQPPEGTPGVADSGTSRHKKLVIAACAVVVALLVGGIVWAVGGGDDETPEDASARTNEATPTTPPNEDPAPGNEQEGEQEAPPASDPDPLDPDSMMTPTGNDELDVAIQDAASFVEEARGLEFIEPVTVEALEVDAFVDRLSEEVDTDQDYLDYLDLLGDRLVALGLVSADSDPVETYLSLLDGGVLGYYDPETGELVVRGTEPSLFLQSVIVHELTHALDDQHFELDRPEVEENDEHSFGFTALVEGNARTVENLWKDQLTDDEAAQLSSEEMAFSLGLDPSMTEGLEGLGDLGDLGSPDELFGDLDEMLEQLEGLGGGEPGSGEDLFGDLDQMLEDLDMEELFGDLEDLGLEDLGLDEGALEDLGGLGLGGDMEGIMILQQILMAPYEDGSVLVEALLDDGGMGRVDEAYDAPPLSSEQVLEPDAYFEGDPIEEVAIPTADGDATNDGLMGQYFLALVLEQVVDGGTVDAAVDGWSGDRFVQWDEGAQRCIRIDVAMDTPDDLTELEDAMSEWAAEQPDAQVTVEGDLVRLTSCN